VLTRLKRVLAVSIVAGLSVLALALLLLHTPPVQSRLLQWSIEELERRFDLDLVAESLRFNLLSRRVSLTEVRLSAAGHRDRPFFTADRIEVQLPWAAYRGRLHYDTVIVEGGQVAILRDAQGRSNLPSGRARDPNAPPRRIDVRGLEVRRLDFVYRDLAGGVEIRAPHITTDLAYDLTRGAAGPFGVGGELVVQVRDRGTVLAPLAGRLAFDGSGVALEGVTLDLPEGAFTLSGTIARALDRPVLDLTIAGTADVSQASRWTRPPIHLAGRAKVDATMTGPPGAFVLSAAVAADALEIGDERGVRVDADARLTPDAIAVSRSTIAPATGGEVQATLEVPFADDAAWWIEANWKGLDAASAFRLAEVRVLPFGAALTGQTRIDRAPGTPFRLRATNVAHPRAGAAAAPLDGTVEFVVAGNRWSAAQEHRVGTARVTGDLGGLWNRDAVTRSTFDGTLTIASTDLGDTVRIAALFGPEMPAILRDASGPIAATVTIGGTFGEPLFTGSMTSDRASVPAIGDVRVRADFDASTRAIAATNITATVTPILGRGDDRERATGSADVRGQVTANLDTRRLSGAFAIDAASAADLFPAVPRTVQIDGALAATATLGGTLDRPEVTAELTSRDLTIAEQPFDTLTAKARLIDTTVILDSFALQQGTGELRATGRYDWESGAYSVDTNGRGLNWRGTLPQRFAGAASQPPLEIAAEIGLTFAGSGTIDDPRGEGALEFVVAGGPAGELIDRGVINLRLADDRALLTGRVPSLGAFISARIVPSRPFDYEAVLVMNRIPLDPLITLGGLQPGYLEGTGSLSALVNGQLAHARDSTAFINLQDIQASVAAVPLQLATPSRLSWNGRALTVDQLDLIVGRGRLVAAGRLGAEGLDSASWSATFNGELGDALTIGRPLGVPEDLHASGALDVTWQSAGGLDRSTASLRLTDGTLAWAALPSLTALSAEATFDGGTLTVSRLSGRWQEGGIEATASVPRAVLEAGRDGPPAAEAGTVRLRVEALSDEALAPWVAANILSNIDGRVSATADVRFTRPTLEGLSGSLTFDQAAFTIAGVKVAPVRPILLQIDEGVLTARDVTLDAGGSPLTVTGTARLAPAGERALDLKIAGTADLRLIGAFAPTLAADGDARLNMGIGGPLDAPVFSGRIDVAGAELAIREPRLLVSDLNGTIALDGQRVIFDSLGGSINGGALTIDGGFLLEGFTPAAGGLTAQIQRAAIEYPAGLQSEADALVTLRPGTAGWTLTGDVRIERSVYTDTISLPALLASRQARRTTLGAEEGWLDRLRLNVFVFTQQDLRLDNNYGRLEAGAALRVGGTATEPTLSGRVTLREGGEVYLAGKTFYVSRGSISFANPTRILPEFDIELGTVVSGRSLALTLEGPLDRLETDVRSTDGSADSREAMSLIFGGFQGEDAVALLSAELLGATGRALGLDALRVERGFETDEYRADPGLVATDIDPSTRLTLSKRLRPDVELVLSQSLRESGGLSAIVSYKPRRNIELRAVSRDNVDRSFAIRHEITFGGGRLAPVSAASEQPQVSAVTISGEPGRPPEELKSLLDLQAGDRFNFRDWQRDLDRLRAAYHDRLQYEVRIRGTRQPSDDDTSVALDYRIDPGPVAELVIEGHPLDAALQEEIREVWKRTIFDRFLLEDIRTRLNRHMLEEGYLGSEIEAVVAEATPSRKRVRVTVRPGTPVRRRSIAYTGARAFSDSRLDGVVASAGLALDGWLDRTRLQDALVGFYRDEGYLAAAVKVDPPRAEGDTAVLPVTIDEGPRYRVASLTLPGVSPDRVPAVAAAVRLDSGAPFVSAELEAAEDRVEAFYASEGFNGVQIEVGSAADPAAATVNVTFAVLEGLQQILRDVETIGATRTRAGVIRRALRLREGTPVNLADWSRARKRLYDTNVFRQVDLEPMPMDPTIEDSAAGIQPMRAVVRVVEYPVWRLRYGGQFSDERNDAEDPLVSGDSRLQSLGVLADLQNQNLFGRAITAGIAGRYERDRQAGSLFTANSSFFGLPIRTSGFVFFSRQRFDVNETFSTIDERRGVTAEQRWRPFANSELIWSYRFEREHLFDPDPAPDEPFPLDVVEYVSRLNAAVILDRRDDPSTPTRGWFTAANYEQPLGLFTTAAGAKTLVQQSAYRRIRRVVVAGRGQLGSSFGGMLPVSQRFLLGGATTVRGYPENALGPRDLFGLPGGDALVALNGEVRFPVIGWINGVGFVDAGNVFTRRGDISLRDLSVGYGLGLRLATPFALLRVDFAIPASTLTPSNPANQLKSGRWYFGIGHVF
jgi:outer membrane protein assembly complex protein YaeT